MFHDFFSKNLALYEIMWKKFDRAKQHTVDNIIRHICLVCWITKATNPYSDYVILIAFHSNNGYANVLQC